MKAEEAKKLSEKSKIVVTKPVLEHVYEKVKEAAQQGKTSITNPLRGYNGNMDEHLKGLTIQALKSQGYVVEVSDVDNYNDSGFINLSW